ncbi:uncharacterized protein LOC115629774 [Scaptodrosophila lebanonensis]|uniref:Uncharacterized protein LOC115629774 n=1 Tax=Drosophila lebanonensis TaxID=7225 RepID=A0A6J2U1G0_DROLE|nr:uncharacterized protein LOC115629774 [Scaptodrosophila lebanonensis]
MATNAVSTPRILTKPINNPQITVTNPERITTKTKAKPEPKSPDTLAALVARKSLTSMSDEEIIQENLKEILDKQSREERKANGRLVAVILAFLVIFVAIYHAWIRKTAALAGMLVPAGIMISYGAWVVILAKRDKHKRALFERHIEEVALKNKNELEEKHSRLKQKSEDPQPSGSAATTLQYVNELMPGREHRKKPRRHRSRQQPAADASVVTVHRSHGKRPSIRQKLFGQTIAHVKLMEQHRDSVDSTTTTTTQTADGDASALELSEKRKRLQRLDTLPMPQVVRMNSAP